MPAFPGTAIAPLSLVDHEKLHPSRLALEQQLREKPPLVRSTRTHGDLPAWDRDTDESSLGLSNALAPLDVKTIRATVTKPLGRPLMTDGRATVSRGPHAHLGQLMPIVTETHHELVGFVGRRMPCDLPETHWYPHYACRRREEPASSADRFPGPATTYEKAERNHPGMRAK
ncbi:hypothetical protein ACFY1P_20465 [Streptomyces sp. NPDC001407]|uniref:hypothetical protein n=1 Tax=Streptomyces sp. NPDC001407 TaxID=3364573 RepID=UPI0036BE18C4